MVDASKDDGERIEEDIDDGEIKGNVNAKQSDDWLGIEHLERPKKDHGKQNFDLGHALGFGFGHYHPKTFGPLLDYGFLVCLGHEAGENESCSGEEKLRPLCPSPSIDLRYVAPNYWTGDGGISYDPQA